MTIETWDDGAEEALKQIRDMGISPAFAQEWDVKTALSVLDQIASTIAMWVREGSPGGKHQDFIMDRICEAGRIGADRFTFTDGDFDIEYLHHLLVRKQRDYGHGNINRFGLTGIAVRLCDKIARLDNLTSKPFNAFNEPIEDTWSDIIGYCVIAIMLHHGWFQLDLEAYDAEPF